MPSTTQDFARADSGGMDSAGIDAGFDGGIDSGLDAGIDAPSIDSGPGEDVGVADGGGPDAAMDAGCENGRQECNGQTLRVCAEGLWREGDCAFEC